MYVVKTKTLISVVHIFKKQDFSMAAVKSLPALIYSADYILLLVL